MQKGRIEFDDPTFRPLLKSAGHALRSYQHGNASPDLAEGIADAIDGALANEHPLDMLIFCPNCKMQHIDRPEPEICECGHRRTRHRKMNQHDTVLSCYEACPCFDFKIAWDNPPHKSHTCRTEDGGCGLIFRIADFPTNGVAEIKTRGEKDTWPEVA